MGWVYPSPEVGDAMEFYKGDCLEIMKQIPDGSVDMVLCDLPFGITRCDWDVRIPFEPLWEQYNRVCKQNAAVVLHGQEPFTSALIMSNLKNFKYTLTWYKHYSRGFLNAKKRPLKVTEQIVVFYRKQCTYNPKMTKGKYRSKGNSSKQRGCYNEYKRIAVKNDLYYPNDILDFAGVPVPQLLHPTQKPVDLLQYLIEMYTNPGEIVLDNCMGVGSTGVACVKSGREFIGIELDENYYNIAVQRINDELTGKQNEEIPEEEEELQMKIKGFEEDNPDG